MTPASRSSRRTGRGRGRGRRYGIAAVAGLVIVTLIAITAISRGSTSGSAETATAQPGPLRFSIDPARQFPISRFIYGANFVESRSWDFARRFPPFTLVRIGGNRLM